MNPVLKFFILCSGSNFTLLHKSPSEYNKHAGIGAVIFFTAVLATLSSGYALYTIFDNIYAAIGFGLFWGLMIFNLDRFIVASMRKTGNFFRQFFMAIPRILLAALLGIVISKPLELKIFEKEVNKQLNVIIDRNKRALQDSVDIRYANLSAAHSDERKEIDDKIAELREAYNYASIELEKEIVGTGSETTTGKVGYGPNAKRKTQLKEEAAKDLESYLAQVKPRLDELNGKIDKLNKEKEAELAAAAPVEDKFNGMAARMQALYELGETNRIMYIASMFIMGLFVSMELAPVLVKLISPKGPYDYLLDKHEYSYKWYGWESKKKLESQSKERVNIKQKQSDERMRQEFGL